MYKIRYLGGGYSRPGLNKYIILFHFCCLQTVVTFIPSVLQATCILVMK